MTQKIKLYTANNLRDNGGNFNKALEYLNDNRSYDFYDQERFSVFVEDLVEFKKEKLEERGFYVTNIHIEDYYGIDVSVDASLDGTCNSPIPYHTRNTLIRNAKFTYYPNEKLKDDFSEEEWNEKIKEADAKVQAEIEEFEKNSFISQLLSDPEHREFFEKLYEDYDYNIEFSVFANSSYPFDIEFYRDCPAYETLQFLFDVAPDMEELEDYYLAYTVEGEDSDFIEDCSSEIWELEKEFVQKKLQPIIDKGENMINDILSEIQKVYIDEKNYFESADYLSEEIDCNPEHYENQLFTFEGDFLTTLHDLEDIHLTIKGVEYTSEDFVLFEQPTGENQPIAV